MKKAPEEQNLLKSAARLIQESSDRLSGIAKKIV